MNGILRKWPAVLPADRRRRHIPAYGPVGVRNRILAGMEVLAGFFIGFPKEAALSLHEAVSGGGGLGFHLGQLFCELGRKVAGIELATGSGIEKGFKFGFAQELEPLADRHDVPGKPEHALKIADRMVRLAGIFTMLVGCGKNFFDDL